MEVVFGIDRFTPVPAPVLTLGTFDGVHLGHRKILSNLVERAHALGGTSVLITFDPHPRSVIQPQHHLKLLNSFDEKMTLLSQTGIDRVLIIPFTRDFSNLSAREFVKEYFADVIRPAEVVIGYDHHFGKDREGSFNKLTELGKTYDFSVHEIPARDLDNVAVSSTG